MDSETVKEIRGLAEDIMFAESKSEAMKPIKKLEFLAGRLRGKIPGNLHYKLGEVISYTKDASGQVSDKEHKLTHAKDYLCEFEVLASK